jgi:dihydropteroate synthase
VLAGLGGLRALGRPIAVGVSRKSFIGAILERPDTAERLAGSLAATAVAVVNGAALIRTHDVAETRDAVRVAERLRP